jgi:hypothetical protein
MMERMPYRKKTAWLLICTALLQEKDQRILLNVVLNIQNHKIIVLS